MSSHVPFLAIRPNEQFNTDPIDTLSAGSTTMDTVPAPSDRVASVKGGLPVPASDASLTPSVVLPTQSSVTSRIPSVLRFPLVAALSLGLSAFFYTIIANYAGFELAAPARDATDSWNVAYFLGWRIVALAFAWFAGLDYQDLISLTCLVNLPYYYLLTTFYDIDNYAGIAALVVDIISVATPFALLRHSNTTYKAGARTQADKIVAQDRSIYGLVSLFGAAVYALVVYGSFYTWLPTHMILHFDGLRNLEKAHNAGLPLLVSVLIPIGLASTHFLFGPAIGTSRNVVELRPAEAKFDPSTANLAETLAWNLGLSTHGWTKRTEILFRRTLTLAACTFANTFIRVLATIEGSEAVGAIGWAAVWATAALLTGLAYGWVGDA